MTTTLFQLRIGHGYFADGALEDWTMAPDPATQAILQRYGLVAAMRDGAFTLTTFQQDATGLLAYLDSQMPGIPLSFWLRCDEQQFFSVTDLPLDWAGQLGLDTGSRVPDGQGWRLAPVLGPRTVQCNGVAGVLSVHAADLLEMGGTNVQLSVEFAARQVHWVYYLVNRGQTRLENPAIGRNGFLFDGPQPIVLAGGENALSFNSGETAFPLQQNPTTMFDLVDRPAGFSWQDADSQEYCVLKGLPAPDGNQLEIKNAGAGKYIFCAMHVYL